MVPSSQKRIAPLIIILIAVGVLVVGGGSAHYFVFNKQSRTSNQNQSSVNLNVQQQNTNNVTNLKVFVTKKQCENESVSPCIYYLCDIPLGDVFKKLCIDGPGTGWYISTVYNQLVQLETTQWKIYTNTKYNYQIKYPEKDWYIDWPRKLEFTETLDSVHLAKVVRQENPYVDQDIIFMRMAILVSSNPNSYTPKEYNGLANLDRYIRIRRGAISPLL